ncbi:MAG: hypothetical protein A2075_21050 [Geobacteraceae bacterium GWC2_58_44]|nr:MAG: hypothetical protein A2075_21050 [Geobacteraceae bacterium GWC2_58_44]HBG05490.1 hypothetical protein [Geobacter sp.]
MKKMLVLLMICLLLPELSLAAQGDREVLIRRAPVPADPPYQGEVRLLRRDSAQVVQTLLNSKVMNRVVAAIQEKELKEWPQDREGSADSRRYTEELVLAHRIVRERAKERQKGGDRERHLQLMIEFVLEAERGYLALYAPTLTQEGDHLVLQKRELLKKLPLSRNYLQKNMQVIIQDSFQLEAGTAIELLQQAAGD